MQNNLVMTSSPHLRDHSSTQRIMQEVCLALLPAGIAGVIIFGWSALMLICVSVATCVLSEFVWEKLTKQTVTIGDWSAVVTGLLLAYNLPANAPWWLAVVGGVIAIVLVKQMFGGIGSNFMNPALTARAILFVSWAALMSSYPQSNFVVDATTSATPLGLLSKGVSGVKVEGGGLILEKGLVEKDFEDLAKEGVWVVGEIGLGTVNNPETAAPMVEWAHKHGFKVQMHTGGTSIPGSSTLTADDVIKTKPDVVSHINGGPTSIPLHEVDRIMDETTFAMEIVQCGNPKTAQYVLNRAAEKGQLGRVIFGNDAPSGTGIIPLGIMRNISFAASMTDIAPEVCVAMATGNPAKVYTKLNRGVIAPGKEADLLIMDTPMGSVGKDAMEAFAAGDIPGLSYVIIDGKINVKKSSNTPPASRKPC